MAPSQSGPVIYYNAYLNSLITYYTGKTRTSSFAVPSGSWEASFEFNPNYNQFTPQPFTDSNSALLLYRYFDGTSTISGGDLIRPSTNISVENLTFTNTKGGYGLALINTTSGSIRFEIGGGNDTLTFNCTRTYTRGDFDRKSGNLLAKSKAAFLSQGGKVLLGPGDDTVTINASSIGLYNTIGSDGGQSSDGLFSLGDGQDQLIIKIFKPDLATLPSNAVLNENYTGIYNEGTIKGDDNSTFFDSSSFSDTIDIEAYEIGLLNGFYYNSLIDLGDDFDILKVKLKGSTSEISGGVAIYNGGRIIMGAGSDEVDAITGGFAIHRAQGTGGTRDVGYIDMGDGNDLVRGFASERSGSYALTEGLFKTETYNGTKHIIYQKISGGDGFDGLELPYGNGQIYQIVTADVAGSYLIRLLNDPKSILLNNTDFNNNGQPVLVPREIYVKDFEFLRKTNGTSFDLIDIAPGIYDTVDFTIT